MRLFSLRQRFAISFLCADVLLFSAGRADAANLLSNPNFDTGIAGWTNSVPAFPVAFNPTADANGNPASGALQALANVPGGILGPNCSAATQCVPVVAGTVYVLSGQTLANPGSGFTQPPAPAADIGVVYFDAPACTGTMLSSLIATPRNLATIPNVWQSAAVAPTPAPSTAVSALVGVSGCTGVVPAERIGVLSAAFDNLSFGPQAAVAQVPTLDVFGLAALVLLMTMGALLALRRRTSG